MMAFTKTPAERAKQERAVTENSRQSSIGSALAKGLPRLLRELQVRIKAGDLVMAKNGAPTLVICSPIEAIFSCESGVGAISMIADGGEIHRFSDIDSCVDFFNQECNSAFCAKEGESMKMTLREALEIQAKQLSHYAKYEYACQQVLAHTADLNNYDLDAKLPVEDVNRLVPRGVAFESYIAESLGLDADYPCDGWRNATTMVFNHYLLNGDQNLNSHTIAAVRDGVIKDGVSLHRFLLSNGYRIVRSQSTYQDEVLGTGVLRGGVIRLDFGLNHRIHFDEIAQSIISDLGCKESPAP